MPTLIRVRGKRGNLKRRGEELLEERERSHTEFIREQTKKATRLSYLENLPIELLQRIFVLSGNPSFASASRRLRDQTLSLFTKQRMITACVRAASCEEYKPGTRQPIERHLSYDEWRPEQHGLRVLTRQSWFNYPLFEAARQQWLLDTAFSEVEYHLTQGEEQKVLSPDRKSEIKRQLREKLDSSIRADHLFSASDAIAFCLRNRELDQIPEQILEWILCFKSGTESLLVGFNIPCRPQLRQFKGIGFCESVVVGFPNSRDTKQTFFMRIKRHFEHIPLSLLRAPFSQPKADILMTLLTGTDFDAHPEIRDSERYRQYPLRNAIEHGLEDAFAEDCLAGAHLFLDIHTVSLMRLTLPELIVHEGEEHWSQHPSRFDLVGSVQNPGHAYPTSPWVFNRLTPGQSWWRNNRPYLRTRHFIACIDAYDRSPEKYAELVKYMTDSASESMHHQGTEQKIPASSLNVFYTRMKQADQIEVHDELARIYQMLCKFPEL